MYKFNEDLYKKTKKLSVGDFIIIPTLVMIIIFSLLNLNTSTGEDKEKYIVTLFMASIFLLTNLYNLLVPKSIGILGKNILNPQIDKLLAEGKTLEAVILDNSVEFRGLMYVAVQSSGNNYAATPFAEVIINFNEIHEVLIKKGNVIINYKQKYCMHNFAVSNYFENSIDFAHELKEKLMINHSYIHFNF